jgi:hypothetical protein
MQGVFCCLRTYSFLFSSFFLKLLDAQLFFSRTVSILLPETMKPDEVDEYCLLLCLCAGRVTTNGISV